MNQNEDYYVRVSKKMSWILRHGIDKLNLKIDNLGRIELNTFLELEEMKNLNVDENIIMYVINNNDKKRFRLDCVDGVKMIGANQGHSKEIGDRINDSELLEPINKPLELCVHGTYKKFINKILETGLKTMTRKHIHFATGYVGDEKVISGARTSAEVFIEIDMELAMNDGIKFYLSSNGVILSNGINNTIEPKYFKKIVYK